MRCAYGRSSGAFTPGGWEFDVITKKREFVRGLCLELAERGDFEILEESLEGFIAYQVGSVKIKYASRQATDEHGHFAVGWLGAIVDRVRDVLGPDSRTSMGRLVWFEQIENVYYGCKSYGDRSASLKRSGKDRVRVLRDAVSPGYADMVKYCLGSCWDY